jgi:hypothetical protein
MQVILSIRAGKISSVTLLRKLRGALEETTCCPRLRWAAPFKMLIAPARLGEYVRRSHFTVLLFQAYLHA